MPSIVKILRVVAYPNRLRILLLLRGEELSVAELQEILTMGQSTISTHLSQLKQAGLVEDRRTGKSNLYRLAPETGEGLAVLKGHDFSRAENAAKSMWALEHFRNHCRLLMQRLNHALALSGVMSLMASAIASSSASLVLALAERRSCLSLAHAFSMGFKSGE